VGEARDPDPPALQQGAGRDLTCQPYPGATATLCEFNRPDVGFMGGYGPARGTGRFGTHATSDRPLEGLLQQSVCRKTALAAAKVSDLACSEVLEPPAFKSVGMGRPSRTVQPWLHARPMFQVRSGCDPATGARHGGQLTCDRLDACRSHDGGTHGSADE
jgi:hypothetical protein